MADEQDHTQGIPVDRTSSIPRPVSPPSATAPPSYPMLRPAPRPPRRSRHSAGVLVAALLLGLLGGVGGGYAVQRLATEERGPTLPDASAGVSDPAGQDGGAALEGSIAGLARQTLPSVAFIAVQAGAGSGVGSGFVVREDGYLITNSHVIESALEGDGQITVEFPDGDPLPAEVVGNDSSYDIAVLKVEASGLTPLTFAGTDRLQVGQSVVAVGAPLGLDNTVTSGIVSALDRPVTAGGEEGVSYINAIQTDAAINPGNSGGPLLDLAGNVVGVTSAIAQLPGELSGGAAAGSIGLGFAIPADQVKRTAEQLIETGSSEHPVMGVHIDVTYTGEGARVLPEARDGAAPVIDGGPADDAGIEAGEIIVAIDDEPIESSSQLIVVLRSRRVGDTVQVRLQDDDGGERTVSVTLQGDSS